MQFIDLLLVRWIFGGQIGHENYGDFEHPTLRGTIWGGSVARTRSSYSICLHLWVRDYGETP